MNTYNKNISKFKKFTFVLGNKSWSWEPTISEIENISKMAEKMLQHSYTDYGLMATLSTDKSAVDIRADLSKTKYGEGHSGIIRSVRLAEHIWMIKNHVTPLWGVITCYAGFDENLTEHEFSSQKASILSFFESLLSSGTIFSTDSFNVNAVVKSISTPKEPMQTSNTKTKNPSSNTKKTFNKMTSSTGDSLQDAIISAVLGNIDLEAISQSVDVRGEIRKEVAEQIKDVRKVELEIHNGGKVKNVGIQHENFEKLLRLISIRLNVMLVGASGSGKTHGVHASAKALDLPYYAISVNPQTTKVDLFGYMDANGKYVTSPFREAYEGGGIFLLDEIDAGSPDVMTALNSATSNGVASFPDGMIEKHKDFVCVACANTYGKGADREYVGRSQMDAATLNRFEVLDWDYDEKLESQIASNEGWTKIVQKVRALITENKIRMIVSPRASISGGKMLQAGFTPIETLKMAVTKGSDSDTYTMILNHVRADLDALNLK